MVSCFKKISQRTDRRHEGEEYRTRIEESPSPVVPNASATHESSLTDVESRSGGADEESEKEEEARGRFAILNISHV